MDLWDRGSCLGSKKMGDGGVGVFVASQTLFDYPSKLGVHQ